MFKAKIRTHKGRPVTFLGYSFLTHFKSVFHFSDMTFFRRTVEFHRFFWENSRSY